MGSASHNGGMTSLPSEDQPRHSVGDDADPVMLVARIAEALPTLDGDELERLAQALDELTEAVGLALETR